MLIGMKDIDFKPIKLDAYKKTVGSVWFKISLVMDMLMVICLKENK